MATPPVPADTLQAVNERLVIASLAERAQAERAEQALQDLRARTSLDPLTQLPTRSLLVDRLEQAMANARRHGSHCAVLFFDIDHFKQYNDTHGHAFGDAVLRTVAARLMANLREVDTASRHGGDEFLIVLAEVVQAGDAQAVATKLAAAIAEPALIDGRPTSISASVGVALFPQHGSTVDTLVAAADAAMYAGKQPHQVPQAHPELNPREEGSASASAASASAASAPAADAPGAGLDDDTAGLLRAANERLIAAALAAQGRMAAAEAAQRRQLVRLSQLLARLLAASSRTEGAWILERESLDLRNVVAAALAEVRALAHSRGQFLLWQPPPLPLPVLGHAPCLQQLLVQLLDDACSCGPDGASIVVSVPVCDAGEPLVLQIEGGGLDAVPAMAQALAQVHGGSLQTRVAPGGDALRLRLPRAVSGQRAPP